MAEDESVLERTAPAPVRELRYGSHPDHVVDVYTGDRAGGRPVVLIHGGFWRPGYDRAHVRPLAAAIAASGANAFAIEYRRAPGSPDASVDDVEAAVDAVTLDARRTPVVVGHSAGGHLALLAAMRRPASVAGVVALAAVSDLVAAQRMDLGSGAVLAYLGADARGRADLDPTPGLPVRVPCVVIHGADDAIVPLSMSQDLVARDPACRLVVLPATGHFEVIDPETPQGRVVLAEIAAATRSG